MKNLKLFVTLFLMTTLTISVWAVPAYRGWQERTLTDGTPITLRQIGDEFYHFWETQDGKIAVEQEDGTFVIQEANSPSPKEVTVRRRAARDRKASGSIRKNYGALQPTKLLVLLVNFSDKSMKSTHNKAFFENLLNGSFPSVQDYFKQSSGNTYIPEFDVFGPYTLSNNMDYYGGNDSNGDDMHPDQMVVDACALAYADGCNFSNYDTNNDGKVDNIYVIYAGYGEAAGAPANTIWPHSWEIYSQYVSGTLTYNGKTLGHYACSAELSGKSGSNSDGVGTFAHEFSHVIGLPDYYDTDYGTNSENYVTPGEWTLMDQGSYNGSGQYPPLYSIYDKYFMGWTTPKFLAKDEVKNVTMTTTWNDGYQITGGASIVACTNTKTVYYIENRQKSGYDQYLPGHGMVVWTVTYNSTRWNSNDLNNTAGTLRYTIVPADGKTKNYGDGADPFPGTKSKKTWTPFTGCALTEITESGSSINFSYNGGVPKTTWDYVLYGENCTYPEDGEINKGNKLELTITPSSGYVLSDAACWDVQMGGTKLTYGTDFTYNAGTNKFTINSVTGDVEIIVEGGRTVNWNAQGSVYKTNVSVGNQITLPDAPANCSSDRQFVGWCTSSTYKSADTPPTYAKTGDAYSVANYYAVYADVSGGGSADATYTFTSKSWAATEGNWTSGKDGAGYNNSGVQVTTGATGANATCPTSYNNISSIVVSYCTNASKGAGSIKLSVNGTEVNESVTSTGGTTPRDLEFDFTETTPSGAPVITVNCGTNSIYICGLTITYGSASYSGFSTDCTAPDPCALTSISLNTDGVKKAFTTNETFNADGLIVTANYSNCSSKAVTPNSVSTPDMSSNGNKTVTVSYTENAVTKTATYNITVSAPTTYAIRFFDGATKLKEESLILGATATPPTVDDCEEYEFVGWYTSTLATDNTTSYSWISDFTVSGAQDYYAVFSHTEGGSSAPIRRANAAVNDVLWAEDFSGYSANNVPSGSVANSHTGTTVYDDGSVTYACTNSNTKIYGDGGPNGNANILIAKGNGTFVVSGIPTGGATELTLAYAKSGSGTLSISVSSNASISGSTITITSGTTVDITFKNTSSGSNLRFDDASVTVKTAGSGGGSSSTTFYTTTKDCTIPTEVTVKFDANGGEGTMTDQTIDYNTATALKANTFERTGYTFLGWSTSSAGAKVYDDEEEVTLTKKVTTLYALWEKNSWKVYFTTPSGATTVTANGVSTSPLTVEYGETVTIVITPDAEHIIGTVTATGGAVLSGEGGTRTFTMPDADVAISITMTDKPTYTINFINMGETISSQQVMEGQAAVKPSDPSACEGYNFVGWWTAELDADNTTAQTWVETFTATDNQNYYAVYSHSEGGSGSGDPSSASYTFTSKSWAATEGNWTSGKDGAGYSNNGVQVTTGASGANATCPTSYSNISSIVVSYCTNTSKGAGSIKMTVDGTDVSNSVSTSGGTSARDLEFDFSGTKPSGAPQITVTCTTNSIYICGVTINYGGGGSSSTTTYTTDPTCTPCENKVTLTKGGESHGTFTVDKADGAHNNCTSDFVVTVSNIVPADGYRLKDVTATGGNNEVTGPDGSGNYTVTYAKGNSITSTVTANFEEIPSHTVIWHSNGDESNTASYQEGKPIVFPETADGCDGKVFMGWSAVEVAEQDDAPEYTASALMGDHDVTYYAVFAEASTGSGSTFDGTTGGSFKIYAQVDDTKYYATGTGGKIASTTNEAEATSYTFTKISDGWTIQSGDTYITYSSSTNLGTSSSAYIWALSSGTKGTWRLTASTTTSTSTTRGWIYRAGQDVFGGYSTGNVTASGTEYYDLEVGSGSGTTYSGYTTSCTVPTEVTVTFNANGGEGTMSAQVMDYNTATALSANAFTREGHTFQGWATSASGAKVYDDGASVTLKKNTTLYAVWQKNSYAITLNELVHGTLETSPASTAEFGATVTVTVTPSSGYLFGSITVTNNTTSATIATSGSGNEQTFTMPASDVTITATVTEIPKYTVTWSMDGDESTKVEYTEGQTIVFPTSATGCDGKTFVGWSTETIAETDEVPTTFITSATMGTSNLTYYAVFADEDEGSGSGSGSGSGDPSSASYTFTSKSWAATEGNWTSGSDGAGYSNNGVQVTTGASGANATCPDSYNDITSIVVSYCTNTSKGAGSIKMTVDGTDVSNSVSTSGGTTARNLTFDFSGTKPSGAPQITVTCTTNSIYICGVTINYGSGGSSSTAYTGYTTSCGAGISAKNIGWITTTKGQKVKRVINVSAKGFDEATTLSAVSSNSHFAVSLGATAVPVSGLTTTLTVEYTPAEFGAREENVEITLTAGDKTKTITVNGRSLPEEFVVITKKDSKWYALPANMSTSGEHDGVEVSPNDNTTPTVVPVSPSTIIYSLASVADSRYTDNGNCVRLVGNENLCLWSNMATSIGKTNIQNKTSVSTAATDNHDWLLSTTDGIHYTIANPHHPQYADGRRLGFDTKFGMYTGATEFFIVSAGCTSQPDDVTVSPHRVDATFAWVSNASSVTIKVYTNELMTEGEKSATATSSPHVFTGLTESTNYWYKLIPGTDTDCAVTGSFQTTGPTIDITEWTDGAVVIHVDDDEMTPVISIDGQEEHGSITGGGATATELFFAKYFEGAGSMKLLSIFNGTGVPVSLENYKLYDRHAGGGASAFNTDVEYDLSVLGTITAGQEIILFTRPSEASLADCSTAFLNSMSDDEHSAPTAKPRWVECSNKGLLKALNFNGNDALILKKEGVIIDVIGSLGTPGQGDNCNNEDAWEGEAKNMDFGKSPSAAEFNAFYEASSKSPVTTADSINLLKAFGVDLENENISVTTARCILFRNKTVTSGEDAVSSNTAGDFVTLTASEWNGRNVCMTTANKTAAGVTDDGQATCNSYQDLGAFNYSEYYVDWTNIIEGITLTPDDKNDEGDYVIHITDMDKYTCMELRFKLMKEGVSVTDVAQKVPIIITGDAETDDPIFSELVKDEHGDPVDISYSRERCATCDVVVLGTGSLTKVTSSATDVAEVGNVKIYSGGSLIVPSGSTYTVNSISFRREEDELATANIQGNVVIKDDGIINKVFFDLRVDPSNWHYFSLPYDVNISDISFVNDDTHKPAIGVDFFIEYYDGEKRARTQSTGCWAMMPADGVLKKGIGYIFGIPGSDKTKREFRFPMSNDVMSEEKADKQVNGIYAYGCDDPNVRPNHRGWNLIGNPYLMNYTTDITDPLLTGLIVPDYPEDPEEKWDGHWKFDPEPSTNLRYIVEPVNNGRSGYIQTTMADYPMNPFTCYFVQVGGTDPDAIQGVDFHLGQVDRSSSPVRRAPAEYEEKEDTHPVWCTVNITNAKGEKDETSMLISNDFTDGYDMMDDLAKMRGTYYQYASVTTKPIIASRNNEGEMAFNALPDASAEAGIPLNYFAAAQGDYTIAYDDKYDKNQEVKEVKLLDKQENEWYDLMEESYTFTSKRVDNTDRFELYVRVERKQPQITTPIDGVGSGDGNGFDTPRKVLINDHVYIQRGGVIYDMTGKQMLNQ